MDLIVRVSTRWKDSGSRMDSMDPLILQSFHSDCSLCCRSDPKIISRGSFMMSPATESPFHHPQPLW